jgi:murein DD-endopeptidase MepM/ murein hydrolase activator NlpD
MLGMLVTAAALGIGLLSPAAAQSLMSDEILSSVTASAISTPNPVLGADGRVHLAYELMVNNPSHVFVTLDKVDMVDPDGTSLWTVDGDALTAMVQSYSGEGTLIPPGGTAVVFLDVSFGPGDSIPSEILGSLTVTRQSKGADGKPAPMPADSPVPDTVTFTASGTGTGNPAIVVSSPLRGAGWLAANGCCDEITSHRGAVMAVNGTVRVPERFAIDWVQIGPDGRIFSGDGSKVEDFAYYGTPIHAVADGVVVNLYDGADAQVPGQITGITTDNIGGNMIVVDIGGGNYAFYAHLQRGSLKVALGDRVKTGDVIALLGNTGNTTAPHLHFHVMDGPSPLDANGLPYVYTHFAGAGVVADADMDAVEGGKPVEIDAARLSGSFVNALPLNNQVVDFD